MMSSFQYLGRMILTADDNFPTVIRNLAKGAGGVEENEEVT